MNLSVPVGYGIWWFGSIRLHWFQVCFMSVLCPSIMFIMSEIDCVFTGFRYGIYKMINQLVGQARPGSLGVCLDPARENTQYPPGLVSHPTESITLTSCSTCGTRCLMKASCSKGNMLDLELVRRRGRGCSDPNCEKLEQLCKIQWPQPPSSCRWRLRLRAAATRDWRMKKIKFKNLVVSHS